MSGVFPGYVLQISVRLFSIPRFRDSDFAQSIKLDNGVRTLLEPRQFLPLHEPQLVDSKWLPYRIDSEAEAA